jgi:hypothetical protein
MNTETMTSMTYIGSFAVDSGQAIVGDPCYLDKWENWAEDEPFDNHKEKAGNYGYLGSCGVTLSESSAGTLGNSEAVAFTTGYGDGLYPVYAKYNEDGRIVMVVIDFNDELNDEEQE